MCPIAKKTPFWGIVALCVISAPAIAVAEGEQAVARVEEDWQLVLNVPADNVDCPQFHTTMSPTGDLSSYYAQVTWNYRSRPDFTAGGLQLHCWNGDTEVRHRSVNTMELSTSAETITWTQSLTTDGLTLSFEISNGQSTTWGEFGKDMKIDEDATVADLSAYSTEVSVANAGITYGSNRVDSMIITEVRRYAADGSLISTDHTQHVLFELSQSE